MDTSRYLDLFVQEALEHLESLGKDLLAMETESGPAPIDSAFRHAHSMKGMSASMGYAPIADLAHCLEDLLEHHRKNASPVETSAIDVALSVTDAMGALVQAAASKSPLESAGVAVEELIARLRAVTPAKEGSKTYPCADTREPAGTENPPPPAPSSLESEDAAAPALEAPRARSHLKIKVRISVTSKVPGVRGFLVHKRLSGLGEILSCDPSLADMKAGRLPQGGLEILLASELGEEAVAAELGTISELDAVEVETVAVSPSLSEDPLGSAQREGAPAAPSGPIRTVRVRTDLLDGFMDGVGELLLAADRLRQLTVGEEPGEISPLTESVERVGRIAKALHRKVMATRMTPLSTVTDRLPRVVREALKGSDKAASLEVEGAEIELDRAILDEIESPLGHIIRNCVDHGVETTKERVTSGKPARGRLRLFARRDRDRVVIDISDDGRGIDVQKVVARAVESGLLTDRAAESLSRREALLLTCHPGLSTAGAVTEISGRGVGLDVVKDTIDSLGGTLEIDSEAGRGALFSLALPLTIAIQRLLLVAVDEDLFAIPVNKVLHVMHVESGRRTTTLGKVMIPYRDELIRTFHLPELLGTGSGSGSALLPHVVVEGASEKLVALTVDGLAGHIEGVVRPLRRPLDLLGGLSGVSLLPDGRPVLVLDLASLVRTAESVEPRALRSA